MLYKGTDKDAFMRASSGGTKKSRSRKYQEYKEQNAKKRKKENTTPKFFQSIFTTIFPKQSVKIKSSVKPTQSKNAKKYIEKKNILDDVRDFRSSKIVSNISNNLAAFIIKCGGRRWNNDTKNYVRASIALAISEVTNKVLEKPQEIIENIKLFIEVEEQIYEIIVWIDKTTNLWETNEKSISLVNGDDIECVEYMHKYPQLAKSFQNVKVMKYKIGDKVLLNDGHLVRIISVNRDKNNYIAISLGKDKTKYIISDADILQLY